MRAASKQYAIFYDRLPKSVDLIMSLSNIGDGMDYAPKDVLVDLSYTERNPIKSVYTHYTCDTGQRMWDTNCLVNAVLGDSAYHLSERGWVTFVDKGEESLMLFRPDSKGNARYQCPGDSYFNAEKLMDIRRHNRINKFPAAYTIESPQPILFGSDATAWAKPRIAQLMDKYLGTEGNKLDPDEFLNVFEPIGYYGTNILQYREAEKMIVDTLYTEMLQKALNIGKKTLFVVTGAPASGKSTVVRKLDLNDAGLVYDAALTGEGRLERVITRGQEAGMEKTTVIMVYNDLLTCYKNSVNRGLRTGRFCTVDYLVTTFRDNIGKLADLHKNHPEVDIIAMDCTGNNGGRRVSIDEALKWKYEVSEAELNSVLTYLDGAIENGEIPTEYLTAATGDLLSIPGLGTENTALAQRINSRVRELTSETR